MFWGKQEEGIIFALFESWIAFVEADNKRLLDNFLIGLDGRGSFVARRYCRFGRIDDIKVVPRQIKRGW